MDWFYVFSLIIVGAIGGYTIGIDIGKHEGYQRGRADEYLAGQNR